MFNPNSRQALGGGRAVVLVVFLLALAACGADPLDVGAPTDDVNNGEGTNNGPANNGPANNGPANNGPTNNGGTDVWQKRDLAPVADWREADYIPRSRPRTVELSPDERTLFVGLEGNLIDPGREVLALDTTFGQVLQRIPVGSSPQGMALSADGSKLYVACQLSNYLSVLDVASRTLLGEIPVSFYAQDLAVSPDGQTLYVSNRWLESVEVVRLDAANGATGAVTGTIRVGTNPRDLVLTQDGMLYVGNLSATSVSLIDLSQGREVYRFHTNSPVNGLATDGTFVFVATLGVGDGHPEVSGTTDGSTYRGDGTRGEGFADINNDLVVIQGRSMNYRYTSDTAEVSHADVEGDYLPSEMIVQGALPEQATVAAGRLFVTMSSSDEVAMLDINPTTGALTRAGLFETGINPFELVVTRDGNSIFVAERLGEGVSKIDVGTGTRTAWNVGRSPQAFPSTAYEMGEALFHTARISSEALPSSVWPNGTRSGDKSCNHCHRESLTDGKVWQVGRGLVVKRGGQRMPPSARNIRDTLPLFWEGVQDETDFDLESSEFAPPPDFGCSEEIEGLAEHGEFFRAVCPERDDFLKRQTRHLDPGGEGFNFFEIGTQLIGAFLVGRPRLLPNPDAQFPTTARAAQIARGRALFHSNPVNCFVCHPSDDAQTPFTTNESIVPVITPSALDNGLTFKYEVDGNFNIPSLRGAWDRPSVFFHDGRAKSLRSAILPPGHAALKVDEDGCQILAQEADKYVNNTVRPVYNGQGCNEVSGRPDTHGGTSQLTPQQIDDLLAYVRSIQ